MQMPLTFRLVFHSVRAIARAGLVLLCGWLLFIPANSTEISALGALPGVSYPPGLRPMRAAKVIVAVAPPYVYTLAARVMGDATPPIGLAFMMEQMAAGRLASRTVQTRPAAPTLIQTDTGITSDRDIDGPRFIKVD